MNNQYQNFTYEIKNQEIKISKYTGEEECPKIPQAIDGLPVTVIGEKAFAEYGFQIKAIEIPPSIRVIEASAFEMCLSLEHVTLQEGVQVIGDDAFWMSSVKTLHIPASVRQLDPQLYANLDKMTIAVDNPWYQIYDGGLYQIRGGDIKGHEGESALQTGVSQEKSMTLLSVVLDADRTSYEVAEGTTHLIKDTFAGLEQLRKITLPASVASIEPGTFENQHRGFGEKGICEVVIAPENRRYYADEYGVYERKPEGGICLIQYLDALLPLDGRVCITAPITSIGYRAFYKTRVCAVTLDMAIDAVDDRAFEDCRDLSTLVFEQDQTKLYIPKKPLDFQETLLRHITYEKYDEVFGILKRIDEKTKMAIARLQAPRCISKAAKTQYEEFLSHNLMEILADVAEREDHKSLSDLAQLHYFTTENVDAVIDVFNRQQKTGMVGYLIDYKSKHLQMDAFDFEL